MKTKPIISIVAFVAAFLTDAEHASSQTPIANMVWIQPGTFTTGSPDSEPARYSQEGPQTRVTISQGFWMGKYEVTQGEYLAVMGNNPSWFAEVNGYGTDLNRPVEKVNWFDATNYCGRLTLRERNAGQLPSGWLYRLPTEAEWEYACRAGTATAFHYGPALRSGMANFYGSYEYPPCGGQTYYCYNPAGIRLERTTTTGSYAPNAWGLYDTHGNVWEWCSDWWSSSLPGGSVSDPQGSATGSYRVIRGGSLGSNASRCRSAARSIGYPAERHHSVGFRVVLIPTVSEWRQTIEAPTVMPTYSDGPTREPGKDSLIVVTHGQIWRLDSPELSTAWVGDMTNKITQYLLANNMNNWQVHGHRWLSKARTVIPDTALANGAIEGGNLGNCINAQAWSHIHLIAHSAGAALIQYASLTVKSKIQSTITVHTTFLDPYVGVRNDWREVYGQLSDWSESYFTRDHDHSIFSPLTEGPINHAYNVDVTWLDPSKEQYDAFDSTSGSEIGTCRVTKTAHIWPYQFYANTIPPIPLDLEPGYDGFGFPLSKEGGNWDFATNQYPVGRNMSRVLGNPDPPCEILRNETTQPFANPALDMTAIPSRTSGTVQINGLDIELLAPGLLAPGGFRPASPQPTQSTWIATFVTPTNAVNFVSFESAFTSGTGADGLLSVYWDTNTIGSVDERVVLPGLQKYTYTFPRMESNTLHVLGFRLDTFTNVASSVIVSNIVLGFVGVRDPFTLRTTTNTSNGLRVLELTGQSGFNYNVDASTNLIDWTNIAILVNTNGIVRFVDHNSTNHSQRFYRAVAP